MIKIKHITTLLLLSLIILTGCQTVDLGMSEEEFKQAVIETNTNIESYAYETIAHIDYVERTGERETVLMKSKQEGTLDRTNQKIHITSKDDIEFRGNVETEELEIYVVNNTLYYRFGNRWIDIPQEQDYFNKQDPVELLTWLLDSGEIHILKEEEINEDQYVVVRLQADLEKLREIAFQGSEPQSLIPLQGRFSEILREYDMTLWIHKEKHTVERYDQTMRVEIDNAQDVNLSLQMNATSTFTNINEAANIELPKEVLEQDPDRIRTTTTFQAPLPNVDMAYAFVEDETVEVSLSNSVGQDIFFTGQTTLFWEEKQHECPLKNILGSDETTLQLGNTTEDADKVRNGEVFRIIWDCSTKEEPNQLDTFTAKSTTFQYVNANTGSIRNHAGNIDIIWE